MEDSIHHGDPTVSSGNQAFRQVRAGYKMLTPKGYQ